MLDLTRILAGPTNGRTLAEHGADVLLVNSARLDNVPPFVMDTSHGKRSTFLDLDDEGDREQLVALASTADVFAQGYRGGAMGRRGLTPEALAERRPGLVYVTMNCYGDVGPWRARPGWEQLAQTVSGIASVQGASGPPVLIPAAACDYTTGYLAALGNDGRALAAEPRRRQLSRACVALSDRDVVRTRAPRRTGRRDWFRRHRSVLRDNRYGVRPPAASGTRRADERDAAALGASDHTARCASSRVVDRELASRCGQVEVMDESTDAAVISASLG